MIATRFGAPKVGRKPKSVRTVQGAPGMGWASFDTRDNHLAAVHGDGLFLTLLGCVLWVVFSEVQGFSMELK